MTMVKIVEVHCPSCGSAATQELRDKPFGSQFSCEHCGTTSVVIIDRNLVELGALQGRGEQICVSCGRIAAHEARYCQCGDSLVRRCVTPHCQRDFPSSHERCDFCGRLQVEMPPDELIQGTVLRVTEFGAFVELPNRTEGLLHVSEFPTKLVGSGEQLTEGQTIGVRVIKVDSRSGVVRLSARSSNWENRKSSA